MWILSYIVFVQFSLLITEIESRMDGVPIGVKCMNNKHRSDDIEGGGSIDCMECDDCGEFDHKCYITCKEHNYAVMGRPYNFCNENQWKYKMPACGKLKAVKCLENKYRNATKRGEILCFEDKEHDNICYIVCNENAIETENPIAYCTGNDGSRYNHYEWTKDDLSQVCKELKPVGCLKGKSSGKIRNGTVTCFGSKASKEKNQCFVACNEGYKLIGRGINYCMDNVWRLSMKMCSKILGKSEVKCLNKNFPNGNILCIKCSTCEYDHECTFSCNENYVFVGTNKINYCHDNNWIYSNRGCQVAMESKCEEIISGAGTITYKSPIEKDTVVNYIVCSPGTYASPEHRLCQLIDSPHYKYKIWRLDGRHSNNPCKKDIIKTDKCLAKSISCAKKLMNTCINSYEEPTCETRENHIWKCTCKIKDRCNLGNETNSVVSKVCYYCNLRNKTSSDFRNECYGCKLNNGVSRECYRCNLGYEKNSGVSRDCFYCNERNEPTSNFSKECYNEKLQEDTFCRERRDVKKCEKRLNCLNIYQYTYCRLEWQKFLTCDCKWQKNPPCLISSLLAYNNSYCHTDLRTLEIVCSYSCPNNVLLKRNTCQRNGLWKYPMETCESVKKWKEDNCTPAEEEYCTFYRESMCLKLKENGFCTRNFLTRRLDCGCKKPKKSWTCPKPDDVDKMPRFCGYNKKLQLWECAYDCMEYPTNDRNITQKIICESNGEWSSTPSFKCKEIECNLVKKTRSANFCFENGCECLETGQTLRPILNGVEKCETGYRPRCITSCYTGSRLIGDGFFYPKYIYNTTRKAHLCLGDSCAKPQLGKHVKMLCNPYDYHRVPDVSVCQFTCSEGWILNGAKSTKCIRGNWTEKPPTCIEETCQNVEPFENGYEICKVENNYNQCQSFCHKQFFMKNTQVRKCSIKKGKFEIPHQRCYRKGSCPIPKINSNILSMKCCPMFYEKKYKCAFSCKNGLPIKGNSVLTCIDGTWSHAVPQCEMEKIDCLQPTGIAHGKAICEISEKKVSRCSYMCNDGYVLYGKTRTKCTENIFDKKREKPVCKKLKCKTPNIKNGYVVCYTDEKPGKYVCDLACKIGMTLNGSNEVICDNDKITWNHAIPTCIKNKCVEPLIKNGLMKCDKIEKGLSCSFHCKDEFDLDGNETAECDDFSLKWNSPLPSCLREICPRPSIPNVIVEECVRDNRRITYTCKFSCKDGKVLKGPRKSVCRRPNKQWHPKLPTCT